MCHHVSIFGFNIFNHDFPPFSSTFPRFPRVFRSVRHVAPTFLAISSSSAPRTVTRITCCVPSPLRTTCAARSRQIPSSAERKAPGATPPMRPLEMRTVVSSGENVLFFCDLLCYFPIIVNNDVFFDWFVDFWICYFPIIVDNDDFFRDLSGDV